MEKKTFPWQVLFTTNIVTKLDGAGDEKVYVIKFVN